MYSKKNWGEMAENCKHHHNIRGTSLQNDLSIFSRIWVQTRKASFQSNACPGHLCPRGFYPSKNAICRCRKYAHLKLLITLFTLLERQPLNLHNFKWTQHRGYQWIKVLFIYRAHIHSCTNSWRVIHSRAQEYSLMVLSEEQNIQGLWGWKTQSRLKPGFFRTFTGIIRGFWRRSLKRRTCGMVRICDVGMEMS